MYKQNQECKLCGLSKSTVDATNTPCMDNKKGTYHDFGEVYKQKIDEMSDEIMKEIDFLCDHWVNGDDKSPYRFGGWREEVRYKLTEIYLNKLKSSLQETLEFVGEDIEIDGTDEYEHPEKWHADRYTNKERFRLRSHLQARLKELE